MQLLVIGGTHFVGRALVEDAVERGHEVTVFHRGPAEPAGFPPVEHVHGDRDGGLEGLAGRTWDAAIDTCGYVPRVVRDSARLLADAVRSYTFISTLSVYPDDAPAGCNEGTPTHQPPFPDTEEITDESYGPLKVACEREALDAFSGRCLVVRPGYIVGPHDPSDRFTYWVRRAAAGGRMLAPGPQDHALQVVDVRDLGAFTLDHVEAGTADVFGVVGPHEPLTWGEAFPLWYRRPTRTPSSNGWTPRSCESASTTARATSHSGISSTRGCIRSMRARRSAQGCITGRSPRRSPTRSRGTAAVVP